MIMKISAPIAGYKVVCYSIIVEFYYNFIDDKYHAAILWFLPDITL